MRRRSSAHSIREPTGFTTPSPRLVRGRLPPAFSLSPPPPPPRSGDVSSPLATNADVSSGFFALRFFFLARGAVAPALAGPRGTTEVRSGERGPNTPDKRCNGKEAFRYFRHETNPRNGLVRDKTREDWPASIAAMGMGLTANLVAVERGLLARGEAVSRTLSTLRFLAASPQGPEPDATGHHGFYYHFLDMNSGRRAWKCELSTIDTALLIAGVLAAAAYFQSEVAEEEEIRALTDTLYRRVDWTWALAGGATVCKGWTPEGGFFPGRWEGYDESLILYLLGLGSPTFPLPAESYAHRLSSYAWREVEGIEMVHAGPLFVHQLSHLWIDCRGIQDAFMREHGLDYFENSRRATLAQQRYAIRNPLGFAGYDDRCWGLTACDGPGPVILSLGGAARQFYDYIARGIPSGPDDGTLAPWAAVSSLPFAPEIVLPTIDYYRHELALAASSSYGFRCSFNPTFPDRSLCARGWVSRYHFGINQGPIVVMIENHRSGLVWDLMRRCPYTVAGLRRAGFRGGWL